MTLIHQLVITAVFVLGPHVRGSGRAAVGWCATSQRRKRPQSRHVIAPPLLIEGCGHTTVR